MNCLCRAMLCPQHSLQLYAVTLTHYYARQPKGLASYANQPNPHFLDVEVFEEFLELLHPMKEKLGPIMFQFEYLNKTKMPSLNAFLVRLALV